jgi:hypothetical protein
MKKCEKNPTQTFKQICSKLKDKKAFYYNALTTIHPPLECPFKAQQYTAANSSIDLTPLSFLPINGFLWIITGRIMSGESREVALCVEGNLRVTRPTSRRHPK